MPTALQRSEQVESVETPVKAGGRGQPEVEKILTRGRMVLRESPEAVFRLVDWLECSGGCLWSHLSHL